MTESAVVDAAIAYYRAKNACWYAKGEADFHAAHRALRKARIEFFDVLSRYTNEEPHPMAFDRTEVKGND